MWCVGVWCVGVMVCGVLVRGVLVCGVLVKWCVVCLWVCLYDAIPTNSEREREVIV